MDFKYQARDSDGKVVKNTISASNRDEAVRAMRSQGLIPITVEIVTGASSMGRSESSRGLLATMQRIGTVPNKVKMLFFRQLATMLQAGLSLVIALDIIEKQETNLIFKDALIDVRKKIDSGLSFSKAMSMNKHFSQLVVALAQAGEEGGVLDSSLDRAASILEKTEAIKRKVKGAMTYPVVIMLIAVGVMWVFLTFVLPMFQEVFKQMGIKLPALTVAMIDLSEFMKDYWWLVIGGFIGTVIGLISFGRTRIGRELFDKMWLKMPIIKGVAFRSVMTRAMRTLSVLVSSGVPILNGLEMAGRVADNFVIKRAFDVLIEGAKRGRTLAISAFDAKVFPPMIIQMIRIGEESGSLDDTLAKVSDWYDDELEQQVKALTSMMEPLMIIVVGVLVAIIAMSVYGPMIGAMEQLTG
ncbi:MAG: type II secretion system F family protein [Synergistaceae bacterium]|nr:type II secretion system F family protein [Synergistaceae bacterium]